MVSPRASDKPIRLLIPAVLLVVAACGKGDSAAADPTRAAHDTLTRHQKDSILAQSAIPGASVVGRAITVQDSGASHQRLVDSIANAP